MLDTKSPDIDPLLAAALTAEIDAINFTAEGISLQGLGMAAADSPGDAGELPMYDRYRPVVTVVAPLLNAPLEVEIDTGSRSVFTDDEYVAYELWIDRRPHGTQLPDQYRELAPVTLDVRGFQKVYDRDPYRGLQFLDLHVLDADEQAVAANMILTEEQPPVGTVQALLYDLPAVHFDAGASSRIVQLANHKDALVITRLLNRLSDADCTALALKVIEADDFYWRATVDSALHILVPKADNKVVGEAIFDSGWYGVEYLIKNMEQYPDMDERKIITAALRGWHTDLDGDKHTCEDTLRGNVFRFKQLTAAELHELSEGLGYELQPFPHGAPEEMRNRWFADHAFGGLEGGFSKNLMGKLVRLRIETGQEDSLHDASYWLKEFGIPKSGKAYDIALIKAQRTQVDYNSQALPEMTVRDDALEADFIAALLHMSSEERAGLNLSAKPEIAQLLFTNPTVRLAYFALTRRDEAGMPYYKDTVIDQKRLHELMDMAVEDYVATFSALDAQKWTDRKVDVHGVIRSLKGCAWFNRELNVVADRSVRHRLGELRQIGLNRKAYIDDVTDWLLRHANSPRDALTRAWGDRALALALGVSRDETGAVASELPDRASAILAWQQAEGLRLLLRDPAEIRKLSKVGLKPEMILGPQREPWRRELTRVLGAKRTSEAFRKHALWTKGRETGSKRLPSGSFDFNLGDGSGTWRLDMLDIDDPRGFTIGVDTGCCMTLGGLSESCIEAAYRSDNAGLLAIYGPDGRINAQSFWYIHPDRPDVLVIDNIEANKGRDPYTIRDAYKRGLIHVLHEYRQRHPDRPDVEQINVGEANGDVRLEDLEKDFSPVSKLSPDIYTDAHQQRVLQKLANPHRR